MNIIQDAKKSEYYSKYYPSIISHIGIRFPLSKLIKVYQAHQKVTNLEPTSDFIKSEIENSKKILRILDDKIKHLSEELKRCREDNDDLDYA